MVAASAPDWVQKAMDMDVGQLRELLDKAIRSALQGHVSEDLPRDTRILGQMCDVLESKIEALPWWGIRRSDRPEESTENLRSAMLLRNARRDAQRFREELNRLDRSHDHDKARSRLVRLVSKWEGKAEGYEKQFREDAARHQVAQDTANRQFWQRIIRRLRSDIERLPEQLEALKLSWRLLPPGHLSIERISREMSLLDAPARPHGVDPCRVQTILALQPPPTRCFVGLDEFDGYIAFAFEQTTRVVLECPEYGNATYIIERDWERLSKLGKQELLSEHPDVVRRLVHAGDWAARVAAALG